MKSYAQDAALLKQNGYVVLKDVFTPEEVGTVAVAIDDMMAGFDGLTDGSGRRLDDGATDARRGRVLEINNARALDRALLGTVIFTRCRAIASALLGVRRASCSFDHVIYKEPNTGSVDWHQDQAYKSTVPRMSSLHFWVPFHPVAEVNGCMQFVPRSHGLGYRDHRVAAGSGTRFADPTNEESIDTCPLAVGDLTIHLPLTLHRSLPNRSEETRRAWILHFSRYGRMEMFTPHNLWDLFRIHLLGRDVVPRHAGGSGESGQQE